jgi:type I restriction enzyme S subunit
MKRVPIAEVCSINPRLSASIASQKEREVDFIPMASLGEDGRISLNGTKNLGEVLKGYTCFQNGDVIVAKITPCMENGKAAYVHNLTHGMAFGSTEFHVLRPNARLDPRFLFHMVWTPFFRREASRNMTGTAGQQRVPTNFFERFEIPLPPLPEQKRIADILDKADAIRRKRREAAQSTEELTHSLFIKTVGPHAEGYSKWPVGTIGDLAATRPNSMRTGPFGSSLLHSEFVDKGVAVLGIDNAVRNRFTWDERRFISHEKYEELKRYTVLPGDVLITIMGTVGRAAVVPADIPLAINTKHLACITPDPSRAVSEFLAQSVFRHPEVLRQLGMAGRGAIMTGLNLGIIRSIRLAVPPISIQHRFDKAVAEIRKTEARMTAAKGDSEHLFNALVGRAFRGEL